MWAAPVIPLPCFMLCSGRFWLSRSFLNVRNCISLVVPARGEVLAFASALWESGSADEWSWHTSPGSDGALRRDRQVDSEDRKWDGGSPSAQLQVSWSSSDI